MLIKGPCAHSLAHRPCAQATAPLTQPRLPHTPDLVLHEGQEASRLPPLSSHNRCCNVPHTRSQGPRGDTCHACQGQCAGETHVPTPGGAEGEDGMPRARRLPACPRGLFLWPCQLWESEPHLRSPDPGPATVQSCRWVLPRASAAMGHSAPGGHWGGGAGSSAHGSLCCFCYWVAPQHLGRGAHRLLPMTPSRPQLAAASEQLPRTRAG